MEWDNDCCCNGNTLNIGRFFKRLFKKKRLMTERAKKRLSDGYTDRWSIREDMNGIDIIKDNYGRVFPVSLIPAGTSMEEHVDNLNEGGYQYYLENARAMFKNMKDGEIQDTKKRGLAQLD